MRISGAVCHLRKVQPPESRRDQEEGGELDSHEEVRLSFAGPGEISRRAVSCRCLTKKPVTETVEGPGREINLT